VLAVGLVAVGIAAPALAQMNQPSDWVTLPGEACVDVGYSTENSASNPYILPAIMPTGLPAGGTYSKVIVKAGNTGTSVVHENTVYAPIEVTGTTVKWIYRAALVAGDAFVHDEKGSISHVIVCAVPAPHLTPVTVTTAPSANPPTCDGDGSLVIPTQTGVIFSGAANGAGPGVYNITGSAANGYSLSGTNKWTITVLAKLTGPACIVTIEPAAAAFADAICTAPGIYGSGSYTIPSVTGVEYEVKIDGGNYGVVVAGTYGVDVGTVVSVKAIATTGYALAGTTTWGPHTIAAPAADCHVIVVPVAPKVVVIEGCGLWGSVTPADTVGVNYVVSPQGVVEGVYTVTATAKDGYILQDGATSDWSGTLEKHTTCVTPTSPTVTQAVCTGPGAFGDGSYTIPSTTGVKYQFGTDGVAFADKAAGTYPVAVGTTVYLRAVAEAGYSLDSEDPVGWGPIVLASPGDCLVVSTIPNDPSSHDQVCLADGDSSTLASGYISVVLQTGVRYTIHNEADADATNDIVVTAADTDLAPGTYRVTAEATPGYTLAPFEPFPLYTIASAGVCEQLPSHALADGSATGTSQTCSATSGLTSGYITVALDQGLSYFIDGVELTSATTNEKPGTYVVTGVAQEGFQWDGDPWTIVIAAASSSCLTAIAELKTLAFTGFSGGAGYVGLAGLLLLLGAAFTIRSRRRSTRP
jgi:hypothetical protein